MKPGSPIDRLRLVVGLIFDIGGGRFWARPDALPRPPACRPDLGMGGRRDESTWQ